jgi:hypothetical protein
VILIRMLEFFDPCAGWIGEKQAWSIHHAVLGHPGGRRQPFTM